jgi:hypothetical protein
LCKLGENKTKQVHESKKGNTGEVQGEGESGSDGGKK